jgi:hypothetical protein
MLFKQHFQSRTRTAEGDYPRPLGHGCPTQNKLPPLTSLLASPSLSFTASGGSAARSFPSSRLRECQWPFAYANPNSSPRWTAAGSLNEAAGCHCGSASVHEAAASELPATRRGRRSPLSRLIGSRAAGGLPCASALAARACPRASAKLTRASAAAAAAPAKCSLTGSGLPGGPGPVTVSGLSLSTRAARHHVSLRVTSRIDPLRQASAHQLIVWCTMRVSTQQFGTWFGSYICLVAVHLCEL